MRTAKPPRPSRRERLAASFGSVARRYERSRPGYPPAAIRYIRRVARLGPGTTVVDLAAGTGKLTRAMRPTRAALVAVEPSDGMRREFRRQLPDVPVLNGRAEAMPLPDGFADAVVVGQAFHWFSGAAALREIARVLRTRGTLVMVWNSRNRRIRWSRKFTEIIERAGGPRPTREQSWRRPFARPTSPFTRLTRRTFPSGQRGPPSLFVDRAISVSLVAAQSGPVRRRVAREVLALLATDPATKGRPIVDLPYVTEVFVVRRKVPRGRRPRRGRGPGTVA